MAVRRREHAPNYTLLLRGQIFGHSLQLRRFVVSRPLTPTGLEVQLHSIEPADDLKRYEALHTSFCCGSLEETVDMMTAIEAVDMMTAKDVGLRVIICAAHRIRARHAKMYGC